MKKTAESVVVEEETDVEEPIYSVQAQQIADDPALDTDTALRQLLTLQTEVMECCMVALWEISDALQLRTAAPKKAKVHDA